MTNHLRNEDVIDVLQVFIEEIQKLTTEPIGPYTVMATDLRLSIATMDFMDKQSEAFKKLWDQKMRIKFPQLYV